MINVLPYKSHKADINAYTALYLDARFGYKDLSFANPKSVTNNGSVIKDIAGRRAFYFDGTDDYLSIPDSADWNFGGDMTVSLWAYPDASYATGHYVLAAHNGYNSSPFGGWDFEFYNGTLRFQFFSSTGGVKYQFNSAANLYIANAWQYFSAIKKGNVVRLFINGIKVAESSSFLSYDAADAALTVGCMKMSGVMSAFFNGYLDKIRICKF